jgi:hypothetical protein
VEEAREGEGGGGGEEDILLLYAVGVGLRR